MSDYEERVAEAVKLCAGGNREAHLYLNIICRSARLIDNLLTIWMNGKRRTLTIWRICFWWSCLIMAFSHPTGTAFCRYI